MYELMKQADEAFPSQDQPITYTLSTCGFQSFFLESTAADLESGVRIFTEMYVVLVVNRSEKHQNFTDVFDE